MYVPQLFELELAPVFALYMVNSSFDHMLSVAISCFFLVFFVFCIFVVLLFSIIAFFLHGAFVHGILARVHKNFTKQKYKTNTYAGLYATWTASNKRIY